MTGLGKASKPRLSSHSRSVCRVKVLLLQRVMFLSSMKKKLMFKFQKHHSFSKTSFFSSKDDKNIIGYENPKKTRVNPGKKRLSRLFSRLRQVCERLLIWWLISSQVSTLPSCSTTFGLLMKQQLMQHQTKKLRQKRSQRR